MMIRTIAAIIALLAATTVSAGSEDTFTLEPSIADGQTIRLRVDSPDGCYPADNVTIQHSTGVIAIRFTIADYIPCDPTWITPRLVPLGTFPPGNYEVRITECTNAPINPCTLRQNLPLTVGGGPPEATAVPVLSPAGFVLLASVLLGFARLRHA